ncbi:hypothetical protein TNCT_209071 [Trichonephila clavata]|uniref:Uncharacterized protein n=1 Tax=Trichonephila clavata TaxID=2740835 RepID=A0A8X6M694_TRICU|nr:hypothetical protein TNCT_209071 [Trichonephila clavata]
MSMPRECLLPDCITSTVKFGRCRIMFGGYFLWYDLGHLIPIRGKLNALPVYYSLDNNLLLTLEQFYWHDHCYLQGANTTYHVERSTVDKNDENGVSRLYQSILESYRKFLGRIRSPNQRG